jgi:hemin uptake protein HemP
MTTDDAAPKSGVNPPQAIRIRELDSRQLLGSERQVKIRHAGEVYELRETRLGKLILTK